MRWIIDEEKLSVLSFQCMLQSSPKEYSKSPALSTVTSAAHPISKKAGISNVIACKMNESHGYIQALLVKA